MGMPSYQACGTARRGLITCLAVGLLVWWFACFSRAWIADRFAGTSIQPHNLSHNGQDSSQQRQPGVLSAPSKHNVLVLVKSGPGARYWQRRNSLRRLWVQRCRNYRGGSSPVQLTCYFVIGNLSLAGQTAEELSSELATNDDIILSDLEDTYRSLLVKTIWMANWSLLARTKSAEYPGAGRSFTHAMFIDDDAFVSLSVFVPWLAQLPSHRVYTGYSHIHSRPIWCDKGANANCVTRRIYEHDHYPHYASGFAYLMSHDVIHLLVQSALRHSLLGLPLAGNNEDAMVGLLLAEGGIDLTPVAGFHHYAQDVYPCPGAGTLPMVIGNAPSWVHERIAENERVGEANLCKGIMRGGNRASNWSDHFSHGLFG